MVPVPTVPSSYLAFFLHTNLLKEPESDKKSSSDSSLIPASTTLENIVMLEKKNIFCLKIRVAGAAHF